MIVIAGDDIYLSIRHELTRNVIAKTDSIPRLGLRFAALGTLASGFRFHGADEASRLPTRMIIQVKLGVQHPFLSTQGRTFAIYQGLRVARVALSRLPLERK